MQAWPLLALAAALSTPGATEKPAAVAAIVREVQQRLDATSDFTAAVDEELVLASAGKTVHATGTVAFKRPGRMRWMLTDGAPQVIVADGATLWFYQPDDHQVLKAPFQAAFRSSTPISFLTGVGRLADDFDVTLENKEGNVLTLGLRQRKADGDLGQLRLSVDARSYDVVGAEVVDPVGNITRLRFSDIRRNTRLADDQFHFDVPAGVDVIEAPIGN